MAVAATGVVAAISSRTTVAVAGAATPVVPGPGAGAEGPEGAARLAADHAYIDALRLREEPADARLTQDWLFGIHQSNLERARGR